MKLVLQEGADRCIEEVPVFVVEKKVQFMTGKLRELPRLFFRRQLGPLAHELKLLELGIAAQGAEQIQH